MSAAKPDSRPRPVLLCVLDGWGERAPAPDNAIALADTPTWDHFMADCPHARLQASGVDVGLPAGQMGNSEVGHMNIGAGRIVVQDLPRIDAALADGSLARNPALARLIERLGASGGTCHLMGLLSPGGVHSHQNHMAALARLVADSGVTVAVHALLDGRDVPPKSAERYVRRFFADLGGRVNVAFATVGGRYYAMDRDKRWERMEKAYLALVEGQGERADDAPGAIARAYAAGQSDEFVTPTVIGGYGGMRDGDGLLVANFRADRMRQILAALADPAFDGFPRSRRVKFKARAGMVEYSDELKEFFEAMFPPPWLTHILGEVVAEAGLTQLRIAETEKYAHVTFFLNGGREQVYPGEERILIPSPRIATYDLKPEMSAFEVTDALIAATASARFDFIVVNYANGDMVGHTGRLDAAIAAAEAVDACLGRLEAAIDAAGGVMLVTADHGNVEMMSDPESGQSHTAHTLNPVPVIVVGAVASACALTDGRLADVAPTLLELMGLPKPAEMTGRSLLASGAAARVAAQQCEGRAG